MSITYIGKITKRGSYYILLPKKMVDNELAKDMFKGMDVDIVLLEDNDGSKYLKVSLRDKYIKNL